MEIRENIPLAPLTTLGVGGPARFFASARKIEDVAELFEWAGTAGVEVFVLGGGSNILVSDSGFQGLVIKIEVDYVRVKGGDGAVLVEVGAGVNWDTFVEKCVGLDLAGLECLSGIPGTVGGTPVQNVGAYGQDVSETIVSVECFDRESGRVVNLSYSDCGFEYRKSIFNTSECDRYVVMSVLFRLRKGGTPKVSYNDLQQLFAGTEPSLADVRDAVLSVRRSKSMVVDPQDPNSRSVGSFFKNPLVSKTIAGEVAKRLGLAEVPHFVAGTGTVKIPAAWLIERAGFEKGFALGNAGISANHSLAIINRASASAAEIIALMELIQKRVYETTGMFLSPEPVFVGF